MDQSQWSLNSLSDSKWSPMGKVWECKGLEYMCHTNEIPSVAISLLMNHALASWRLPSWLYEEQQLAWGVCQLRDTSHLEQPSMNDSAEHWAQFMHQHQYQWQTTPGILLDQTRVSLPHVRGHLLACQQIPSGLSQRQHFRLYLHLMEVFTLPGLYCQV